MEPQEMDKCKLEKETEIILIFTRLLINLLDSILRICLRNAGMCKLKSVRSTLLPGKEMDLHCRKKGFLMSIKNFLDCEG